MAYASRESSVLKELGPQLVACPTCDGPMDFKKDKPIFCKVCGWPERRSDKPRPHQRKVNGV